MKKPPVMQFDRRFRLLLSTVYNQQRSQYKRCYPTRGKSHPKVIMLRLIVKKQIDSNQQYNTNYFYQVIITAVFFLLGIAPMDTR